MNPNHHQINEEVIDFIGAKNLEALHLKYGNHRFSFGGLLNSERRRTALELIMTYTIEMVAAKINRSVKQTIRILAS